MPPGNAVDRFRRCCWYIGDRVQQWEKAWLDLGSPTIERQKALKNERLEALHELSKWQVGVPWNPARPPELEPRIFLNKLDHTRLGTDLLKLCTQAEILHRKIVALEMLSASTDTARPGFTECKRRVELSLLHAPFGVAMRLYPGPEAFRPDRLDALIARFGDVAPSRGQDVLLRRLVRPLIFDEARFRYGLELCDDHFGGLRDVPFSLQELDASGGAGRALP